VDFWFAARTKPAPRTQPLDRSFPLSDIQGKLPQPIRDDLGAPTLGPRNVPLERENSDLLASPYTDAGTMPNLKFSFAG
jgi:oxalate decarboxylase